MEAEGFALVMLCQCRPISRRLAVHILRESRAVLRLINQAAAANSSSGNKTEESHPPQQAQVQGATTAGDLCCIDVLDSLAPTILERVLPLLPPHERVSLNVKAWCLNHGYDECPIPF